MNPSNKATTSATGAEEEPKKLFGLLQTKQYGFAA
jgi:hypothetical protein